MTVSETEIFGATYADAYNALYTSKDYGAECDLLEQLFLRYGATPVMSVVDFGCGTGNHAFPFAHRGYDVVGVERSPDMLARALQRLAHADDSGGPGTPSPPNAPSPPGTQRQLRFQPGDIRSVDLGRKFDVALMMFAVLGYQIENSDVMAALQTARRHLDPGGLFICDIWYGPAVLRQRPADRIKTIPTEQGRILRAASGELDITRQTCAVRYHMWHLQADRLVAETDETHIMRFFFPQELSLLLEWAGFSPVRLGAFPDFDNEPDETTWNAMMVARAV